MRHKKLHLDVKNKEGVVEMDKKELNLLIDRYKSTCLMCDYIQNGFTEDSVSACTGCKKFSKSDMALLLNGLYTARQSVAVNAKLGLNDAVLVRIFELHYKGVSKYSIVKQINAEFPRKSKGRRKLETVNWRQVNFVIEGRYTSNDAKGRISAAKEKALLL